MEKFPRRTGAQWITALVAVLAFITVGILPWFRSATNAPSAVDVAANVAANRVPSNSAQVLAASDPNLAVWDDLRRTLLSSPSRPNERSPEFPSGLRPLADSLQETFGGLRQLIPSSVDGAAGAERQGMTAVQSLATLG